MDILTGLGLAIPAGLNAYIPLLAVAASQRMGFVELGEPYALLGETWVIALITVLLVVEIVADKVPAVDSINDSIQTLIRPAAGGLLFVASTNAGEWLPPAAYVVAGVFVAGGVHAVKTAARPVVNAATGGAGGPVVSFAEDMAALIATIIALVAPILVILTVAAVIFAATRLRRARNRPA